MILFIQVKGAEYGLLILKKRLRPFTIHSCKEINDDQTSCRNKKAATDERGSVSGPLANESRKPGEK